MSTTDTAIIGAGPAGLACAASLRQRHQQFLVLEQSDDLGSSWRGHYDRLHLHTHRKHSALPGYRMPASYPRYPSRLQVVEYLEEYARHHSIEPAFGERVSGLSKGKFWEIETTSGTVQANNVIVATGLARLPNRPTWQDQSAYSGTLVHSSDFSNADSLDAKSVLVVGFGNSGGEIALECVEAGLTVGMSVRSAVNIIPREMFGVPTLSFAIMQQGIPHRAVDAFNRPFLRMRFGDIQKFGLKWAQKGPMTQIIERGQTPLIDIGTMRHIQTGSIKVFGEIRRTEDRVVSFKGGDEAEFDAIVVATGYRPGLSDFVSDWRERFRNGEVPDEGQLHPNKDGLYFCGFNVVPTGHLRQIGKEARQIARDIAK